MGRLLLTSTFVVVALCWLYPTAEAFFNFRKNTERYLPPHVKEEPLDLLDKFYKKLDDLQCKVKTGKEQLDALEAQMGMLKRNLQEIVLVALARLNLQYLAQSEKIQNLQSEVDRANSSLDALYDCLENVTETNNNSLYQWTAVTTELVNLERSDCLQRGRLAELSTRVEGFKAKIKQVYGNEFMLLGDQVNDVSTELASIRQCESQRICESGIVTLDPDDRRGEYLYQNLYRNIPQVSFSISSYRFRLDTRPMPPPSYGSFYPWVEPNTIGVYVSAIPSRTGVTFEKFNLAFGDTQNQKITVSFQACSIGAGLQTTH